MGIWRRILTFFGIRRETDAFGESKEKTRWKLTGNNIKPIKPVVKPLRKAKPTTMSARRGIAHPSHSKPPSGNLPHRSIAQNTCDRDVIKEHLKTPPDDESTTTMSATVSPTRIEPAIPDMPQSTVTKDSQGILNSHSSNMIATPKTSVKLTVGLDFGTSTVKCVVLARIGNRMREERFVVPIAGRPLFPSTCWEQDDALFIGTRPEQVGREFRSSKACLRCEILGEEYPDSTYRDSGCSPSAICWAILSYCVENIKKQVRNRFPDDKYEFDWRNDVAWNMGAPMDGMKHEHLREHFVGLLWLAVNHGFGWCQGIGNYPGISDLYESMRSKYPTLIEGADDTVYSGNCSVFPEAHVAVNAFLLSGGNFDPGLYYVCDVGAGTTDIAFFRYAPRAEREVSFYEASSTFAGGDNIARELSISSGLNMEQANQSIVEGLTQTQIARLSDSLAKLKGQIYETRRIAFGRAYTKERDMEIWKRNFRGSSIMGGGSQITGIRTSCTSPLRTGNGSETITVEDISLRKEDMPTDASELHRIAFGLSIPPERFYRHWRPDEVEVWQPPTRAEFNPFPGGNPYEK